MKIDIIAAGRLRKGPLFELLQEYERRLKWSLSIHEIESKHTAAAAIQQDEEAKILKQLSPGAFIIAMDERGQSLPSLDFAKKIGDLQTNGHSHLQFVIGGADGLTDTLRTQAGFLLSFGRQTWPHMLARVMLLEQIYRAQQILDGHPYHRE
ncbi:MAG: 23S rRNA (pseudouridine(1915)-N(3))-methyltransferase RlmH [Alphaproteobacteria bacterium]|nr:23S rRNA (pseudouridine(1915)-N(3))-methyltransferase RlmH [Alphaproteobacteria bacterium]